MCLLCARKSIENLVLGLESMTVLSNSINILCTYARCSGHAPIRFESLGPTIVSSLSVSSATHMLTNTALLAYFSCQPWYTLLGTKPYNVCHQLTRCRKVDGRRHHTSLIYKKELYLTGSLVNTYSFFLLYLSVLQIYVIFMSAKKVGFHRHKERTSSGSAG